MDLPRLAMPRGGNVDPKLSLLPGGAPPQEESPNARLVQMLTWGLVERHRELEIEKKKLELMLLKSQIEKEIQSTALRPFAFSQWNCVSPLNTTGPVFFETNNKNKEDKKKTKKLQARKRSASTSDVPTEPPLFPETRKRAKSTPSPHASGRICTMSDCCKLARGNTNLCASHGGGKRCEHPDCPKAARGSTRFCIAHGGGKRCEVQGCTKSAQGPTSKCIAHGGGRRCKFPDCSKSARGASGCCTTHAKLLLQTQQ